MACDMVKNPMGYDWENGKKLIFRNRCVCKSGTNLYASIYHVDIFWYIGVSFYTSFPRNLRWRNWNLAKLMSGICRCKSHTKHQSRPALVVFPTACRFKGSEKKSCTSSWGECHPIQYLQGLKYYGAGLLSSTLSLFH